jgi:Kef-type K+ transport system membrane component KefB
MTNVMAGSQVLVSPTINLLLVMVLIWTMGVIFRKIKQPPVLGELLAGIIFGPCLLGIIQPDPTLEVLSELGVFFLMFYAGLETNALELKRSTKLSSMIGIFGFVLPMVSGYWVSKYVFQLDDAQSLFIGLGLSITSIAVNSRVLIDMGLQKYRVTPVILGASIIDDVLSLAVLSSIIGFVVGGSLLDIETTMFVFAKVFIFFGITIFIGIKVYPRLSPYFATREAKGFTFALIIALVFGLIAEVAGLHVILGAYMAGLFINERSMSKELYQKINDRFVSITYGFLGPIFFVNLSFHVTFGVFSEYLGFIAVLLAVAILGKLIGAGIGSYLGKMSTEESAIVALAMNGRGELELIIASIGLSMGIINDAVFSMLIVVAFATTLMSPVTMGMVINKMGKAGLKPCALDDLQQKEDSC